MNVTIPIEVSGDIWYNEQAVRQQLEQLASNTRITLDLRSEGPSLARLGIAAVVDAWLAQHRLSPDTVMVIRWSNGGESVDYKKSRCSVPSHFWYYAQEYRLPPETVFGGTRSYLFGLFLGRATVHRNVIMYQVQQQWAKRFLISRLTAMTPSGVLVPEPWNIQNFSGCRLPETLSDWMPGQESQVINWFATQQFVSLDGRATRDQYTDANSHFVHNRSMLAHYDKFNIELVCESCTLGQTFFPTEKTARPIAGTKPWLIYAAPGYIQHLKRMGFRSFDSVWDESYDQLEGPARWSAMRQVIQRLIDLDAAQLNDLLSQAHEIARYNHQHLETVRP
jgi:hypothetical protein